MHAKLWVSMSKIACSDSRYTYYHKIKSGSLQTIDVHEIIVARSNGRIIFLCASVLLLLLHVSNLAFLQNVSEVLILLTLHIYIFGFFSDKCFNFWSVDFSFSVILKNVFLMRLPSLFS